MFDHRPAHHPPGGSSPRFLRELNVMHLRVRAMSMYVDGWVNRANGERSLEIEINQELPHLERLITFVHELVHVMHPDWNEVDVSDDENRLLQALGIPEHVNQRYG